MNIYERGKGAAESMFGKPRGNRARRQMRNVFIGISLAGLSLYGLSRLEAGRMR